MKTLVCINIIVFFLVLNSCFKRCPPFDRSLTAWIPYNISDTIKLKSNMNDSILFIVESVSITDDPETTRYGCSSNISLRATNDTDKSNYIRQEIYYAGERSIYFLTSMYFNNNGGEFSIQNIDINNEVLSEMTLDGNYYTNVLVFQRDTIKYQTAAGYYWKLIVVKDIGIVKLYEKDTGVEWSVF